MKVQEAMIISLSLYPNTIRTSEVITCVDLEAQAGLGSKSLAMGWQTEWAPPSP